MPTAQAQDYASQLTDLARQLNAFAASLKAQRRGSRSQSKKVREVAVEYTVNQSDGPSTPLFIEQELEWLHNI